MLIKLPAYLISVAKKILASGYKCYLAGGSVRDIALNKTPKDYDLATDALPGELLQIFPNALTIGAKFGTVVDVYKASNGENYNIEITTFRVDGEYKNGRWPTKVGFVRTIEEDLARRDLTINAMAMDLSPLKEYSNDALIASRSIIADSDNLPRKDLEQIEFDLEIIDPFCGLKDIESKIIRAVGDPVARFIEDGLRPFRACRFVATLNYTMDEATFNAITQTLDVASKVSIERIREELEKIIARAEKPSIAIELMRRSGLLKLFLPELVKAYGVEQKLFHIHDVYTHLLRSFDLAPPKIRMAALLHDIAKPLKDTKDGHFYGHDIEGAKLAEQIMTRLRFPKREIKFVTNLIRWHMFKYPVKSMKHKETDFWTDGAVRRFIRNVGIENIPYLFELRKADAGSNPYTEFDPTEIIELQKHIDRIMQEDNAFSVKDLRVNGDDLQNELGLKPSSKIGEILNKLLELCIENPKLNSREKLLKFAKDMV